MSVLDVVTAINASDAASDAATAAKEAKKARQLSEERIESMAQNKFVILELYKLDVEVESTGFFSSKKTRTLGSTSKTSLKRTDISHVTEYEDSHGSKAAKVYLEERCNLWDDEYNPYVFMNEDKTYILAKGSIEEVVNLINN